MGAAPHMQPDNLLYNPSVHAVSIFGITLENQEKHFMRTHGAGIKVYGQV